MILIRTDANEMIGVGHIMRCLSVAHALTEIGEEVQFVTADHNVEMLISDYECWCLETDFCNMESELQRLSAIIQERNPSCLLIDSYYVTEKYFDDLSSIVTTAYFDDLNANPWNIDCLINYNIYASSLNYSCYDSTRTRLLLNPQYAPLRDEFIHMPRHIINDSVQDILVSAGGADPAEVTEKLIHSVCKDFPNIRFHFLIGALNHRKERIKTMESEHIILHINEKHVSDLMMKCDIAISAAGTTLYELCATGLPTITFILADNQISAASQFESQRIMLNAGDCRNSSKFVDETKKHIKKLISNKKLREELSCHMRKLVDGNGSYRIAQELLK